MPTTFAVPDGRVAMAATLYTGNGSTQSVSNAVNTVSFQPGLVWVKNRSNVVSHALIDSVRGAPNRLTSDQTEAENSGGNDYTLYGGVSALSSAGFTASSGTDPTYKATNGSGQTYIGWQWKAGAAAVSNTAGTITSSVSANTTAGFSIVTFTGNGVDTLSGVATVGHGLGVTPSFIITKKRSSGTDYNWSTYHISNGNANIWLNTTSAKNPGNWVTAPAATVFTPPVSLYGNESGVNYVAYCWTPVAGYSAFGSYTGNGSANGPFIYTGFRPRFVMIKSSTYTSNWDMLDSSRDPANVVSHQLFANLSGTEFTPYNFGDLNSNGFKIRDNSSGLQGNYNVSGETYIYAAFAENPLKYSNAR